jgi:hypothetical protein
MAPLLAVLLLLLGAAALRADEAGAQAYYRRGLAFQAAKRYAKAEACYQAALRADPKAAYALKALGTNAYLSGDQAAALRWYRQYLALNPFDRATKAFADRLQARLGDDALKPPEKRLGGGADIHVSLGGAYADSADLTKLYYSPGPPNTDSVAMAVAVGGAWGFSSGLTLGVDFSAGPLRDYTVNYSNGTADKWVFMPFNVMAELGWRIPLTDRLVLQPRVGLGVAVVSAQYDESNGWSRTADGAGLAYWPELTCEYQLGRWGLTAALGYYSSSVSPMVDSADQMPWKDASGSDWAMVTHGVTFSLGTSFHFRPLLR